MFFQLRWCAMEDMRDLKSDSHPSGCNRTLSLSVKGEWGGLYQRIDSCSMRPQKNDAILTIVLLIVKKGNRVNEGMMG